MRYSQGLAAELCRLTKLCGVCCTLLAVGCAAGGGHNAPVAARETALTACANYAGSEFVLAVLPDSFIDGATAQTASLELQADGAGLAATLSLAGARGLKGLYTTLAYDSTRWRPVGYEALGGFADPARTLSISNFDTPGEAQAGCVLRNWTRRQGHSGDFAALRIRFARGACTRHTSSSPNAAPPFHPPLAWNPQDFTLNWYFYNPGDYNQNGVVGLTDLTPLAQYWGQSAAPEDFDYTTAQSQVDGNGNGSIEIGDLTILGVNWDNSALGGCHVYHSADAADYPADSPAAPVDNELLIATVATATGFGGPGDRKRFSYELPALTPGEHYWVRPFDGVQDLAATRMCTIPKAGQGDWWMLGREPLHQRRSAVTGPLQGELAWNFETTGPGAAFGSPLHGPDGTVYSVGGGKVYAVSPDNALRWRCEIAANPEPPLLGSDGKIYVTTIDNTLCAIASNGSVAWRYAAPDKINGGACAGANGLVHFSGADGKLYAVNPDGTLAWAYDRGAALGATPTAALDGTVYVADSLGLVAAVSTGGVELWSYDTSGEISGSLALGPNGEVYAALADRLVALAPDGSFDWAYNPPGSCAPTPPAVREDGFVLFGADDGKLYTLNAGGTVEWIYNAAEALYAAPLVSSQGVVALITNPGRLIVLTENGAELWTATLDAYSNTTPVLGSAGQVYAGGTHRLYAFDEAGAQLWTRNAGGEFVCNPTIDADGTIYAPCLDGKLYALDPDGTLRWSYEGEGISWASPALKEDGTVLLPNGDRLYALSPEGAGLWEFHAGSDIHSSPVVDALGYIYFGCADHKVYALYPDGTVAWTYLTMGDLSISSPALWTDGTLYIGSAYRSSAATVDGKLYAIDSEGKLKWAYEAGGVIWSSPLLLDDGRIVFGTVGATAVVALYPTGTQAWQYTLDAYAQGSAALGLDGTIYIGDQAGNLYALAPTGALIWRNGLGGPSSPCIGADGTLYTGGYREFGIFGLDPQTGEQLWSVPTDNAVVGSPAIGADGTLYCGANDCSFYAIRDP